MTGSMHRREDRREHRGVGCRTGWLAVALSIALFGAASAGAQSRPDGEAVKWDQARVTKYAVDLNAAVKQAVHAVRKSPTQAAVQQRKVWYDLRETLRLLENTTGHLQSELQGGASAEETRATFDRIDTLRRDAESTGRSAMIPAPVLDALVEAGAIHNQMRPYYYGKS
jgi:predicted phage gp36 major capsid-like protein